MQTFHFKHSFWLIIYRYFDHKKVNVLFDTYVIERKMYLALIRSTEGECSAHLVW